MNLVEPHPSLSKQQRRTVNKMASKTVGKYNFLSQPEDALKCLICLEVAEEPWQHGDCGRLYCKKCILRYGKEKDCPNCKMSHPQYFPDNKSKREIHALRVLCSNSKRNCTWKGTVGTIQSHLNVCQYELLACPKKCKDARFKIQHIMRRNLEKHLAEQCPNRRHSCQYCGQEGTYAEIMEVHDKICEKKIVPCTNKDCLTLMQRRYLGMHVNLECEHTAEPCKHRGIGCGVVLKRKDMPAHEQDDKLHLHMAINTITDMKKEACMIKPGGSITLKFENYQHHKDKNKPFLSPFFYTCNGYHMVAKIDANGIKTAVGTHLSVQVVMLNGKHNSKLAWPFVGKTTVILLNQLEDKNHHMLTKESSNTTEGGVVFNAPNFISHSALGHNPGMNRQYLKDGTLYFTISVTVANYKPWLKCTV